MKITKRELRQMINESVRKVLNESKINYNSTIQTLLKKYKVDYYIDDRFSKSIFYKIDDENGLKVEFSVIKDDYVESEGIPRFFILLHQQTEQNVYLNYFIGQITQTIFLINLHIILQIKT